MILDRNPNTPPDGLVGDNPCIGGIAGVDDALRGDVVLDPCALHIPASSGSIAGVNDALRGDVVLDPCALHIPASSGRAV
jgi:hypothetical protein